MNQSLVILNKNLDIRRSWRVSQSKFFEKVWENFCSQSHSPWQAMLGTRKFSQSKFFKRVWENCCSQKFSQIFL